MALILRPLPHSRPVDVTWQLLPSEGWVHFSTPRPCELLCLRGCSRVRGASLELASRGCVCFPKPFPFCRHGSNLFTWCMQAKLLQLCPILRDPMGGSPPGSLSMGFSRQEHWSGLPCPPPGGLSDPGIVLASLTSPVLAGRFFTTSATWEAPIDAAKYLTTQRTDPSADNYVAHIISQC